MASKQLAQIHSFVLYSPFSRHMWRITLSSVWWLVVLKTDVRSALSPGCSGENRLILFYAMSNERRQPCEEINKAGKPLSLRMKAYVPCMNHSGPTYLTLIYFLASRPTSFTNSIKGFSKTI